MIRYWNSNTSPRKLFRLVGAKRLIVIGFLAILLVCAAGCGRSVPKEYGMYLYDGRRPVALERAQWRALENEAGKWNLAFMEATAVDPAAESSSIVPGVLKPEDLQLLVYFQGLQASNVVMCRTEFDLIVKDAIVPDDSQAVNRHEIYEQRRDVLQGATPTACLENWMTPVNGIIGPLNDRHWQPRIQGGNVGTGLFREAVRPGYVVDLLVAPVKGTPDAFLLTPKQPLSPGVYMLLVKGDDSSVITMGKGGTLVRVGSQADVRAMIDAGVESAVETLRRVNLNALAAGVPDTSPRRASQEAGTAGKHNEAVEDWERVSMIVVGPGPDGVSDADVQTLEATIRRLNSGEGLVGSGNVAAYIVCRRERVGEWLQALGSLKTFTVLAQYDRALLRSWRPYPLKGVYIELRFKDQSVAKSAAILDSFLTASGANVWNLIAPEDPQGSFYVISDVVLNPGDIRRALGDQVSVLRDDIWRSQ